MAQGKAYDKDKVMEALEPYFKLGCNIKKACSYAGIPYETVWKWIDKDEELAIKVTAWQNEINETARKVWRDKIEDGDYNAAKDWISKKEKDEFSDRQEVTGKDGEAVIKGFNYVAPVEVENNVEIEADDTNSNTTT